jgi:hypothetical protein
MELLSQYFSYIAVSLLLLYVLSGFVCLFVFFGVPIHFVCLLKSRAFVGFIIETSAFESAY